MTEKQTTGSHRFLQLVGSLAAAAPVLVFSWILFNVWANPMAWSGGKWVPFGVGVMLLEFLLLHSGVFMAVCLHGPFPLKKRVLGFIGLLVFYGLMAWGFSTSTGSPELLWIFGAVVLGRSLTAVFNREAGMNYMIARSATGVFFYIIIVFATVMLPIPEWGITREVVATVYPDHGSGVWEQEPHRAIAGAAVYFLIMGLMEFFLLGPALSREEGLADSGGAVGGTGA